MITSAGLFRAEMGLANNRPIDMEPYLNELEPDRNPNFEKILRAIGQKVAKKRMKFEWRRRDLIPQSVKVTAVTNAGGSTVSVDNFAYVHKDALMFNTRTKALYLVQLTGSLEQANAAAIPVLEYPSAGTLTAATAIGDVINILPESHAEGEEVPGAFRSQEVDAFDYIMQLDRRGAEITDIAMNEEEYDPRGQRALDNKEAMIELMRGLSLLFYVSKSTREVTSASGPRRHAMGGLREKIVTNRISLAGVGGGLTPQLFGEILRKTKYQGVANGVKLAMLGQYAIAAVSAWPVGSVQVSPNTKDWGYDVKTVITPHGNMDLVYDPSLTDDNGLAGVMAILDTAHVRQVYLQNMGMQVIQKVANLSTTHTIVDAITLTAGLQVKFEELFAWVEDIT